MSVVMDMTTPTRSELRAALDRICELEASLNKRILEAEMSLSRRLLEAEMSLSKRLHEANMRQSERAYDAERQLRTEFALAGTMREASMTRTLTAIRETHDRLFDRVIEIEAGLAAESATDTVG